MADGKTQNQVFENGKLLEDGKLLESKRII
jgi:hypothetical protein